VEPRSRRFILPLDARLLVGGAARIENGKGMNREDKAAVIDEVVEAIGESQAIFAVDYRGITVAQVADLRQKLRSSDTKLRVVKNSLSERAADRAGAEALKPFLIGPTALAFVRGDAALAAKTLSDANRTLRILEFKGGMMNGSPLTAADVQSIARLPSRDVLNGQLVGTIAAPLTGIVRTLNALIAGLAIQLGAIAEQGLVSGTAAPAAEPAEPEAEAASAAEPEAEVPAEPEPVAPAEPEAEVPAEPEAVAPAEPEAGAEPEAAESAEPEPEAEAPAEAEPQTTEGASDDAPSDDA
jgi:large subunit ribosomal protein L10